MHLLRVYWFERRKGIEVYPDVGVTNVMGWNAAHVLLFVNSLNVAHVAMVAR